MQEVEIVIVGAGIVGLSTALLFAQHDYTVALVDAKSYLTPNPSLDSRIFAINKASINLFRELGVWSLCSEEAISPYRNMLVWDAVTQKKLAFDCRMIAASELGVVLAERAMQDALLQRLQSYSNVLFLPENTVMAITENKTHIALTTSHQYISGKLLIIADGAHSTCRQLLKVPVKTWSYHQQAIVGSVKTEKKHQQTAYQVFHPNGPLAFLPLKDSNACSIIWSINHKDAKELMLLPPNKFNQSLAKAFEHRLGEVALCSKRTMFPLHFCHAEQYAGKHWILLGDAAHSIHPLAGLGLNMGLADVSILLKYLHCKPAIFSSITLRQYARKQKTAAWKTIVLLDIIKTLFSNSLLPYVQLRKWGLSSLNNLPFIKRLIIRYATGTSANSWGSF